MARDGDPFIPVGVAERVAEQCKVLLEHASPDDMVAAAERAWRREPTDPASQFLQAMILDMAGRVSDAEALFRHIVATEPDFPQARYSLGLNLLRQGRFSEGWPLYEARLEVISASRDVPRLFPYPRWRGEPLPGKHIVLFPEQGYGDQIQYVRFVPHLISRGAKVTLLTRPALMRLFKHNFPTANVLQASGNVRFDDPDFWLTLSDLPAKLAITPEQLGRKPYLTAPNLRQEPSGDLKIGLMTRGNPHYGLDRFRSLPPDMAKWLQDRLPQPLTDLAPEATGAADFADTASIISGLDLVVAVDTSVAHLAGAMGKKCLLLLPGFGTDWRWMHHGRDTPWYPQHLLYRGGSDGSWQGAIEAAVGDARKLAMPVRGLVRDAARLRERGRFSEALAVGRKAIAADPRHPGALHNLARLLADLGRNRDAEALQRRAMSLAPHHPDFQYGLGLNLLAQGRYEEGWPLYDARTRMADLNNGLPRDVPFPRWQGEDISGKSVMIFPEQGLGDQLQFARFLPWLRERCGSISLLAPASLAELFSLAFPGIAVVPATKGASYSRKDVWTILADLPRLAKTTLATLPSANYLQTIVKGVALREIFSIGLMTRGNPNYSLDRHRSLPAVAERQLREMLPGAAVELAPEISGASDFLETARIMASLDVVISVDTAVGHLAGALGKPCLMLLSEFAMDWRWLRDRNDSPWYPHHHLYRNDVNGDWGGAIDAVVAYARELAAARA